MHGAPKAAGSCGGELRRPVADGPADMLGVGWVSARSSEGRLDGWTGRWGVRRRSRRRCEIGLESGVRRVPNG